MVNYTKPLKFSAEMLTAIKQASDKVFGNMPIVNRRTGFKLLKRKPFGPIAIHHYVPNFAPNFRKLDPTFKTEQEEQTAEKLVRLKRRGKTAPKKGQGKRHSRKR
jgi:hypothetical protein